MTPSPVLQKSHSMQVGCLEVCTPVTYSSLVDENPKNICSAMLELYLLLYYILMIVIVTMIVIVIRSKRIDQRFSALTVRGINRLSVCLVWQLVWGNHCVPPWFWQHPHLRNYKIWFRQTRCDSKHTRNQVNHLNLKYRIACEKQRVLNLNSLMYTRQILRLSLSCLRKWSLKSTHLSFMFWLFVFFIKIITQ